MKEIDGSSAGVAQYCARILEDYKLEAIKVLEVGPSLQLADYFVIATGQNARQLKAASDELFRKLREAGVHRSGVEGYRDAQWILIDLADVIVHLLLEDKRQFYDIDSLWGDCPHLQWAAESSGSMESPGVRKTEGG